MLRTECRGEEWKQRGRRGYGPKNSTETMEIWTWVVAVKEWDVVRFWINFAYRAIWTSWWIIWAALEKHAYKNFGMCIRKDWVDLTEIRKQREQQGWEKKICELCFRYVKSEVSIRKTCAYICIYTHRYSIHTSQWLFFFSFVDIFPYQDIKIVSWERDILCISLSLL